MQSGGQRALQDPEGWLRAAARRESNVSVDIRLEATRRESATDDAPEHGVGSRLTARW